MFRGDGVNETVRSARHDEATFTTEALEKPLTVLVRPMIQLFVSTSSLYADLFMHISK